MDESLMLDEKKVLYAVNTFFFLLVSLPYALVPYNSSHVDLGFMLDLQWVRLLAVFGVLFQLGIYWMIYRDGKDYVDRGF